MGILDKRSSFSPFEYQQAYQYWEKQQQAHWLHTEISMVADIHDWKFNLTDTEKNVIGNTLKGFTQMEVVVNEYWGRKVSKWFPKPEICMMASAFSNMETVHTKAYAYLNESLGLEDYNGFLDEPTAKAKIDNLIHVKGSDRNDIARSLATFSGFAEGVSLFSSFAILMNFSRRNLLKGLGQVVAFSVKDESLHSEAGCWLFRQLVQEYPELLTDKLKQSIYDAARLTVSLEDAFIDKVFEMGDIEDFDPKDLKNYIRMRTNTKLVDLGLKTNWKNLDKLDWFDYTTVGVEHQDFFAQRVSSYSKGVVDFSEIFEEKSNENKIDVVN
jgi:ribonucleoside-diphosphate reductase beta chain